MNHPLTTAIFNVFDSHVMCVMSPVHAPQDMTICFLKNFQGHQQLSDILSEHGFEIVNHHQTSRGVRYNVKAK